MAEHTKKEMVEHIRGICCVAPQNCKVLQMYVEKVGMDVDDLLGLGLAHETLRKTDTNRQEKHNPPHLGNATRTPELAERMRPQRQFKDPDSLLRMAVRLGASDLHLKSGALPRVRIGGKLRTLDVETNQKEEQEDKLIGSLSDQQQSQLMSEGSIDLAYDLPGSDRFRINIYRQGSGISIAARRVVRDIPSLKELYLPSVMEKISENRQGLVLLAGITGSGKSSTIAAMLEHINRTRSEHIVTIEDPIEYLYTDKKCLIDQREIGLNVKDFPTALRALVREDPDVVLIGEMRDAETFEAALHAAETGHLVFGTIHASNCGQTIGRILNLFPENAHQAIRQSLAFNLRAVVCQKLLPSIASGVSRVPAVEVMIVTPIIKKLIAEGRDNELIEVISGGDEGMQSFTDSLFYLVKQEFVEMQTALQEAPNPEQFRMRLKGIVTSQRSLVG